METMEMPMTSGVAVSTTSFDETEFSTSTVTANDSEAVFEIASDSPRNDETERGTQTIDTLLENAAENGEGFENIFEKIARGEFEVEAGEAEVELETEAEVAEDMLEEEMLDDDVTMSSEEFQVLEEKMDTVIENTKAILENQDKASPEIRMSAKEFFDMILAMYQVAKQEKSKKKRGNMFLFLINLVGTFMQSIADPESLDKKVESMKTEELEEEEPDEDNLIDMMKYLEKNGMLHVA
jgi:hypothetical protein